MSWGTAFVRPFLLMLAASIAACAFAEGKIENEIRQRVRENLPAGPGGDTDDENPPQIDEDAITINSLLPNRGLTIGGLTVEIIGENFVTGMKVYFGTLEGTNVTVLTANRIQCITPAHVGIGYVGVRVTDPTTGKSGLQANAFEYFDAVTATAISPVRGPSDGGTIVAITGTGFIADTSVRFGDGSAVDATVIDGSHLVVTTPPLMRDVYSVMVSNLNGTFTIENAFATFDPVGVHAIEPFAGPLAGGTPITILGAGFVDPTELMLGTQILAATGNISETELAATTILAPGGTLEGAVDVKTTNVNGTDTLENAFFFYDDADPTPRVIAVSPAVGLISGGGDVRIVGSGFSNAPTTVTIGGTIASCIVFDDHMITCGTPAGVAGPTLINVTNSVMNVALPFTYIDLRVDSLMPNLGAIAGGTYVEFIGSGFGADAEVFFGSRAARDVVVANDTSLSLRTPRGSVGLSDIRVVTQGVEITVADAFTFFNPTDLNEWTSGGPIEGSINVTVVDGDSNSPLAGAFVMVGPEIGAPYLSGFTDIRGQITLSGPEVFGAQTVHAAKVDFGSFTWAETNSQNLTLALNPFPPPPPDPLPECPQDNGGAGMPPLVRGHVYRVKDELNTGNDTVIVTTTYVSFSAPLPDPGPKAQLVSQGEYEAFVREGDLVLIALAGPVMPNGVHDVRAMGFRPFVYTEGSTGAACTESPTCDLGEECWREDPGDEEGVCVRVYNDMDILIDTPINNPMRIEFDKAPLSPGAYPNWAEPDTASVLVWYDFGSMGVHSMGASYSGTPVVFIDMPKQLPAAIATTPFNIQGDVSGVGFVGDQTWSTATKYGLTNTLQTITLTPVLRVFHETEPAIFGLVSDPMHFDFEQVPDNGVAPPSGNLHYIYKVVNVPQCIHPIMGVVSQPTAVIEWLVLSPGDVGTFDLPVFPSPLEGANLSSGQHGWQFMGFYSPNADYEHLDLGELYDWQSQTGRATAFISP